MAMMNRRRILQGSLASMGGLVALGARAGFGADNPMPPELRAAIEHEASPPPSSAIRKAISRSPSSSITTALIAARWCR